MVKATLILTPLPDFRILFEKNRDWSEKMLDRDSFFTTRIIHNRLFDRHQNCGDDTASGFSHIPVNSSTRTVLKPKPQVTTVES